MVCGNHISYTHRVKIDSGKQILGRQKKILLGGGGIAAKQSDGSFIKQIDTMKKGRINYISTLQRKSGVLEKLNKKGGNMLRREMTIL